MYISCSFTLLPKDKLNEAAAPFRTARVMYISCASTLLCFYIIGKTIGTSSESTSASSAWALEDAARFLAICMKIQNAGDVHQQKSNSLRMLFGCSRAVQGTQLRPLLSTAAVPS